MMNSDETRPTGGEEHQRLEPTLEKIVGRIAESQPPDELTKRSMDSAKRELAGRNRIGARRPIPPTWSWGIVLAVATAILVTATLLWLPRRDHNGGDLVRKSNSAPVVDTEEFDADWVNQSPTLWAYHQSACRSPEGLDDLLAEHAARFNVSGPVATMSPFGS